MYINNGAMYHVFHLPETSNIWVKYIYTSAGNWFIRSYSELLQTSVVCALFIYFLYVQVVRL